jgi:hypothetical protein
MDPETTLCEAEAAAAAGDAATVAERLGDLIDWLSRNGYRPERLTARLAALRDVLTDTLTNA